MEISATSNHSINAQVSANINAEQSKVSGFGAALDNAIKEKDKAALKEGCEAFESYFLQIMFREMRKTTNSIDTFLPKSRAEEIFQDLLDEEHSKNIAQGQGIGLAKMMYNQMASQIENQIVPKG